MSEVVVSSAGYLKQEIVAGTHRLLADEPVEAGGSGAGPDPYSLLLAALGACTSMTLQIYARPKQWSLEKVTVRLRHGCIHAADRANCSTTDGMVDRIERVISLEGSLTAEQNTPLLAIAQKCPVHKTLSAEISIVSSLD